MPRHFLEIDDLTAAEVARVVELSLELDVPPVLGGQGVALLFEKPSGRTRNSMEVAVVQLGGHPTTIGPSEVGIDTRETAEDVARMLSCYHALIAGRVFEQSKLNRMATVASVPVVNLLSDAGHPIQALADLLTLVEHFGVGGSGDVLSGIAGRRVAYVGDANNVAFSLGLVCGRASMEFVVSHPDGYGFDEEQLRRLTAAGTDLTTVSDPCDAVAGADVVYTDAWYSMGQEEEKERRSAIFPPWQVNPELMSLAKPDAVFLHCLPAHRGEEVTDEILDGPQSLVWQQAENRMHSARGLMWFLCGEADAEPPGAG